MAVFGQRLRQTPHNLQCLYDIKRRVFCVKAYPVLSPQGASIVIYGHENGISIVWRGGRRFKDEKKPEPKPATKNDSVMVLDSDSDDGAASAAASASTAALQNRPVFEDAPSGTNEGGFANVVQTLDLALNQAVLSIATLPIAPCAAQDAEPSFLQQHMVFAITCRATANVFVVTVPLTPPSDRSKTRPQLQANLLAGNLGNGVFGDTLIPLGGQSRRCEGAAIVLAKTAAAAPLAAPSATSASGTASGSRSPPTRVIVAAHSREASGTLRLWDVTVDTERASSERPIEPFQTEYLPSPLSGLAFNPTHPTQLLAVDPQRAVRIYDYTLPAIPSDDASEGPFPPQGSWLLSLYPPFARAGASAAVAARKPVVAAAWIAHGHAILALLADGQWGIWDIDRASTSSSGSGRSGRDGGGIGGVFGTGSAASGLRGAALTTFSVTGQIEGTTPLRNPAAGGSRKSGEGDFVPMTPHTRRDALAASFAGSAERLVAPPGGVEVVQQRPLRGTTAGKETAVLWLGGAEYVVAAIPDVARFWDSQLRRASGGGGGISLFSGARPTRMVRVQDINASLQGERCCGAVVVPSPQRPTNSTFDDGNDGEDGEDDGVSAGERRDRPAEILVLGESRLVAVQELSGPSNGASSTSLTTRLLAASTRKRNVSGSGGGDGGTATSAILVEPRTRKPGTVKFDLDSLRFGGGGGGGADAPRRPPLTKSLFESPPRTSAAAAVAGGALTPQRPRPRSLFDENEVTLTQSMMRPQRHTRPELAFAGDLDKAAEASDDEDAVLDRNVEEEMLDIMEIDRELQAMEGRRDAPKVFDFGSA